MIPIMYIYVQDRFEEPKFVLLLKQFFLFYNRIVIYCRIWARMKLAVLDVIRGSYIDWRCIEFTERIIMACDRSSAKLDNTEQVGQRKLPVLLG